MKKIKIWIKKTDKLILIVAGFVLVFSCVSRQKSQQSKEESKVVIDSVVIKHVEEIVFTFISISCDEFEKTFKKRYINRTFQDRVIIDSLLKILNNLEPLDTIYSWTGVDTRATITLFSNQDSMKYCVDMAIILHQDFYYKTPQTLINVIDEHTEHPDYCYWNLRNK